MKKTIVLFLAIFLLLSISSIVLAQDECNSSICEEPPPVIYPDGKGCLSIFVLPFVVGGKLYFEKKGIK